MNTEGRNFNVLPGEDEERAREIQQANAVVEADTEEAQRRRSLSDLERRAADQYVASPGHAANVDIAQARLESEAPGAPDNPLAEFPPQGNAIDVGPALGYTREGDQDKNQDQNQRAA